jgi:hypothetical protein
MLEPLYELELWDQTAPSEQDLIIRALSDRHTDGLDLVETKIFECGDQRHRIAVFIHEASGLRLHLIPGGIRKVYDGFVDKNAGQRRVDPFLISCFPITRKLWLRDHSKGPDRDWPMVQIHPSDIEKWLADWTGLKLRLPTDCEWEHAAWSGTAKRFPWGSEPDPGSYWFDKNSADQLHSVMLHSGHPNAFGLVDCIGHVWELCAEGHGNGGCFQSHPYSFDLQIDPPLKACPNLGFRVACSLSPDL